MNQYGTKEKGAGAPVALTTIWIWNSFILANKIMKPQHHFMRSTEDSTPCGFSLFMLQRNTDHRIKVIEIRKEYTVFEKSLNYRSSG